MKVSNCCGADGGAFIPTQHTEIITYEIYELCPKCGEHCEYIEKENVKHMNQTEQLAREFSRQLRHYLSEHEMSQVISLNEAEEDPTICHSHDFCDANEAMQDAFIKLFGRSCNIYPLNDQNKDIALWNAAWAMAKENKFYQ